MYQEGFSTHSPSEGATGNLVRATEMHLICIKKKQISVDSLIFNIEILSERNMHPNIQWVFFIVIGAALATILYVSYHPSLSGTYTDSDGTVHARPISVVNC